MTDARSTKRTKSAKRTRSTRTAAAPATPAQAARETAHARRRLSLFNLAGLAAALAGATAAALAGAPRSSPGLHAARAPETSSELPRPIPLPGGGEALPDATFHPVPLRPFRRIFSTNLVTDRLAAELVPADRILAFSAAGARTSPWRHQYAGKQTAEGFGPLEPLIALRPDLVLWNSYGVSRRALELRAAGVEVFDLGELRGAANVAAVARAIGVLVGAPERGDRFARSFLRRLARVAAPLGDRPRRRALFLSAIGKDVYGGTRGSSYHDVLVSAGLVDVAAARHEGWPKYRAEDVLALDPELVVVKDGSGPALCAHPGLDRLRACREPDLLLELPAPLLDEPGPAILDAAELLFAKAYPDLAARPSPAPPGILPE